MNDCDGVTDEDDAVDAPTWYIDHDSDGYGSDDYTWVSCDAPDGYIAGDTDCDDHLATTNPDADELCDDVDNDCDGAIDEDAVDVLEFFADGDGDGFGDAESAVWACSTPEGHVEDDSDCDDDDDSAYPGAPGWTIDCEAIVNVPGDTGDIGDTGDDDDTGASLDTGDGPVGTEDTGPLDTGDDLDDDPIGDPSEDTGDEADDEADDDAGNSDKGCGCASAPQDPTTPWLLTLALLGFVRTRSRKRSI
jgi:MYXO-CTERM domain-containing protein